METTYRHLTLFFGSTWELGLVLSWKKIYLDMIDEDGGFILIEVNTAKAEEIFEKFEKRYITSSKAFTYQCLLIYFDPLHNKLQELQDQIYKELKLTIINTKAAQFQM